MTSIWQVHTWSILNCVSISFESSITCSLNVSCMLAYSNIRKWSPTMKTWWWHFAYVPVMYLYSLLYTVIWRYMKVYVGISGCQDSRCSRRLLLQGEGVEKRKRDDLNECFDLVGICCWDAQSMYSESVQTAAELFNIGWSLYHDVPTSTLFKLKTAQYILSTYRRLGVHTKFMLQLHSNFILGTY